MDSRNTVKSGSSAAECIAETADLTDYAMVIQNLQAVQVELERYYALYSATKLELQKHIKKKYDYPCPNLSPPMLGQTLSALKLLDVDAQVQRALLLEKLGLCDYALKELQRISESFAGNCAAAIHMSRLFLIAGDIVKSSTLLNSIDTHRLDDDCSSQYWRLQRYLGTVKHFGALRPREKKNSYFGVNDVSCAIDLIRISECRSVVTLVGWIVDPLRNVEELVLICPNAAREIRLYPGDLFDRPDLSEVIKSHSMSSSEGVGFKTSIIFENALNVGERSLYDCIGVSLYLKSGKELLLCSAVEVAPLSDDIVLEMVNTGWRDPCSIRHWRIT